MYRSVVAAFAAVVSVTASAAVVTADQAAVAASNFVANAKYPGASRPDVLKIVPIESGGETVAYLASCSDGTVIALSSETGIQPVFAVFDKACDGEGNITLPRRHPMWDVTECVATNCLDRLRLARTPKPTNGPLLKSAAPNDGSDANEAEWANLLGRVKRPALKAAVQVEDREEMILPGFEPGGPLTHWDQTYAVKDMAERPARPLYNYYVYDAESGGTDAGIGIHESDPDMWPCGCVLTAQAAAAQYKRIRGIVASPRMYYDPDREGNITTNGVPISSRLSVVTGEYDWDILPSNYGGTNSPVYHDSGFTEAQRELIGRVVFNYTIYHAMERGVDFEPGGTGSVQMDCNSFFYGALVEDTIGHGHGGMSPNDAFVVFSGMYPDPTRTARALVDPIRFGEPVVMSVRGGLGGHCILATGYSRVRDAYGETWFRTFMGWAGRGDAWVKAGSSVYSGLSTIRYARTHGSATGVGCPGVFIHIPRVTIATAVMYDGETVSFPCTVEPSYSYSSSGYVISNSLELVYAYPYSDSYKPPSAGSLRRYGVVASAGTYTYKGIDVNFYPEGSANPNGFYYSFQDLPVSQGIPFPTWRVNVGSAILGGFLPFYAPTAYTLRTKSTDSHAFGFAYGTPQMIQTAQWAAFDANKPLLVITGEDGTYDATLDALKRGDAASLVPSFVPFFIDRRYDNPGILDGTNSVMVADPYSLDPTSGEMWSSVSASRLSYGSLSDPLDVVKVLQRGLSAYGSLDPARPNVYGIPWYRTPGFDSNPHTLSTTSTSVDSDIREMGYTSVRSSTVTSLSRSVQSRTDSTLLYFDFTSSPLATLSGQVFRNFSKLASVAGFPSTVLTIPQYCFADCTGLADLSGWPSWIASLPTGCFHGCNSLKDLTTLPETVTSIGTECFRDCDGLESTAGMSHITSLGDSAFSFIAAPPSGIPSEFHIVDWPAAVTFVPRSTFYRRTNLKSLDGIPDSVTGFGYGAFWLTGLTVAAMPASLTEIGDRCFYACERLATVDFRNVRDFKSVTFGSGCFGNRASAVDIQFYVPVTVDEMEDIDISGWGLTAGHAVFHCTDGDVNYL